MGWVVNATPRPLYPPGNKTGTNCIGAGWAPGLFWRGTENLAPTGIRSPGRPGRSESLYRLLYPGPPILYYTILTLLYYTILHYTILYYIILYYTNTIRYYTNTNTILYYTILYYTILYYTILYYNILYYTILYYTILQSSVIRKDLP